MDKKLFDLYDRQNDASMQPGGVLSIEEKEKLNEWEKTSHQLKKLSEVDSDEKYFTSVLPKFREAQKRKASTFSLGKVVVSSSFAYAAVITLVVLFRSTQIGIEYAPNTDTGNEKSLAVVTQDSYIAPSDEYSDKISGDEKIEVAFDKTIYTTLAGANGNRTDYSIIKSDADYDEVLSRLDDKELEKLYAQLEQTKIL